MAIMGIWTRVIPFAASGSEEYSREEIEQIMQTRYAIKEFGQNLTIHVKNLLEYLQSIKKE